MNLILYWSLSKNRFWASGSQPGVVLAPWGHLTSSGDREGLDCHDPGGERAEGIEYLEASDDGQHTAMSGMASPKENLPSPNVHSAKVDEPYFTWFTRISNSDNLQNLIFLHMF